MNCDTYLQMLETLPVNELAYGDAAHHADNCRDCDRVTRVVAERERNMLLAYGTITAPVPTAPLVTHALELSRRRRVAFYYRIALGFAAVASLVGFAMVRRIVPSGAHSNETIIALHCLSGQQAFEILRPNIPREVGLRLVTTEPSFVRIIASKAETRRLREILAHYDNPVVSQCGVGTVGSGPGAQP